MSKSMKITSIIIGVIIAVFFAVGTVAVVGTLRSQAITDTGLPRLDVCTGGVKIVSKEDYVDCTVTLSGAAEEFCFENAEAGIRGRGNTTWKNAPKKPYRIKFSEKTSIFGEKKNKSWVLLAMYNDFSYVKDRLAFGLADSLGTEDFVPSYNYVELYLDGVYQGLYLMTDQVDENSGRTAVKEDFTETDVEVPFLVEMDLYSYLEGEEDVAWFTVSGSPYTIKYPEEDERYTTAQFDYIKGYIQKVDSLCRKKGVTVAELSEYIDLDSFIDYFIVQETMGQMEINGKSVYMSKAVGEPLKMGPVWDFDWSVTGPHTWLDARDMYKDDCTGLRSTYNWFALLYKNSTEFRALLSERWTEVRPLLLAEMDKVEAEWDTVYAAAKKDSCKWQSLRFFYKGFEACHEEVFEWCRGRVEWLDGAFLLP